MHILRELCLLLADKENGKEIQRWNNNVEAFFITQSSGAPAIEDEVEQLKEAGSLLHPCILSSVLGSCSKGMLESDVSLDVGCAFESNVDAENASRKVALITKRCFAFIENEEELQIIAELLRSSKNLLRYFTQVIAPRLDSQPDTPILKRLSSNGMLELYLAILQTKHPEPARHASLSLFYCIYNPMDEESIAASNSFLIDKADVLEVICGLLLKSRPTNFVLTLVRHVHNLVASVQDTTERINVILMELSANRTKEHNAPWVRDVESGLDLTSLLVRIADWCLRSKPSFPGHQGDRRADLLSESLRVLFVLRAGETLLDSSAAEEENSAKRLVCDILRLPETDRSFGSKLNTVSLLMDAPPSIADYLAQHESIGPLLSVLDVQVFAVVDNCIVGNQAAAALTPILVVLNNVSTANARVLQTVKKHIFPPEAEEAFQQKAAEQVGRASDNGVGAKNMSPLDAPKGSLRWKLVRLMTWTESHTKRLANELLWTVCGSDAREFVLRTGFGNAMPHLAYRGLVPMPAGMSR